MSAAPSDFVAATPPQTRAVTRALRAVVRRAATGAHEMVYHDALCYSTTEALANVVVYIAPASRHARLGFFFGARVPDPEGLLEGTGARMRHVKVRSVAEARAPAVADLVRAAWSNAEAEQAGLRARRASKRTR